MVRISTLQLPIYLIAMYLTTCPLGADKLTAAMRLKKSSKVCQRCALDIKDRMLIYWYKTESNRVPGKPPSFRHKKVHCTLC